MSPTWSVLVLSCNLNVKAIVDTGHAQGGVRHEDMRGEGEDENKGGKRGKQASVASYLPPTLVQAMSVFRRGKNLKLMQLNLLDGGLNMHKM